MADPGTLRTAAARLNALAGILASALDRVVRGSGAEVWRGPVADRFESETVVERAGLARAADELRFLARTVLTEADTVQATLDAARARPLAHVG